MGCEAAMANEHDVNLTTGAGAFEKSPVFPVHILRHQQDVFLP